MMSILQENYLFLFVYVLILFFVLFFNFLVFLRELSLFFLSVLFLFSSFLLFSLNKFIFYVQYIISIYNLSVLNNVGLLYILGVDGFSAIFVFLLILLFFLVIIYNWILGYKIKSFFFLLFSMLFLLLNVFLVFDFLLFYIYFEGILIPMFILIGIWGSRERKVHAAYLFFLYTFFGSMFMLFGILVFFDYFGSSNVFILTGCNFINEEILFLWLGIFFSIAVKVPMFPVHVWLPEAHVEAPTVGSVILAGILLKLGTYAILRFLFFIFSISNFFFFIVNLFSVLGVIFASLTALVQIDIKKIIAYSSVAHMSIVIGGFFSFLLFGLSGGVFLMFSHGIVSAALFFLIGLIYERFKSRIVFYFGGLIACMPIFSTIFFIFTLANVAFPTTIGFIGEALVLLSILLKNFFLGFSFSLSVILGAFYSFWFFIRLVGGLVSVVFFYPFFCDVTRREFFIFFILLFFNFFFGLFPNYFLIILDSFTFVSFFNII